MDKIKKQAISLVEPSFIEAIDIQSSIRELELIMKSFDHNDCSKLVGKISETLTPII